MGHTPRRDPHPQGDLGHGATLPNANCQVRGRQTGRGITQDQAPLCRQPHPVEVWAPPSMGCLSTRLCPPTALLSHPCIS